MQTFFDCTLVSSHAGEDIRERTDALDAAGNTTAAIGKGFAIGSAALVSLALFGAYITRSKIDLVESSILDPKVSMSQMGMWWPARCAMLCLCCSDVTVPLLIQQLSSLATSIPAAAAASEPPCMCLPACWLAPCFPSGSVPRRVCPTPLLLPLTVAVCVIVCRCLLACLLVLCFPSGSVP